MLRDGGRGLVRFARPCRAFRLLRHGASGNHATEGRIQSRREQAEGGRQWAGGRVRSRRHAGGIGSDA